VVHELDLTMKRALFVNIEGAHAGSATQNIHRTLMKKHAYTNFVKLRYPVHCSYEK